MFDWQRRRRFARFAKNFNSPLFKADIEILSIEHGMSRREIIQILLKNNFESKHFRDDFSSFNYYLKRGEEAPFIGQYKDSRKRCHFSNIRIHGLEELDQ